MPYKIEYTYDTGDSFHTEENVKGELPNRWNNLEVARDNLQRIKSHYEYYQLQHRGSWVKTSKQVNKEIRQAKNQSWFVQEYDFCLRLTTDDGKDVQISAPWCGYFERLKSAQILSDGDDRDRIVF